MNSSLFLNKRLNIFSTEQKHVIIQMDEIHIKLGHILQRRQTSWSLI